MLSDLLYICLPIGYMKNYLSKFPPVLWMILAKNSLYFQFIMLKLLFDFSRGEVFLMTRLNDFIENCRWALPTMSILLQRAKPSSPALSSGASARTALSLSSRDQAVFFLLLLKAVTVFHFSFICGRYELYLFFCNWFLFSFLSTCLWTSSVLCRALSMSAVAGALPVQQLPLPSCLQHPGHCPCFLCSLGHPAAGNHTSSSAAIPFFHPVPCSCAAANSAWERLERLQVSLAQDEWLSFQSPHLQQVIPGSQVIFCISYCSNNVTPWCSAGTKGSAHWFLQAWLPS